jgi:hypothetical protein
MHGILAIVVQPWWGLVMGRGHPYMGIMVRDGLCSCDPLSLYMFISLGYSSRGGVSLLFCLSAPSQIHLFQKFMGCLAVALGPLVPLWLGLAVPATVT